MLALVLAALAGLFWRPLAELARFAWGNDLYSYILLVPLVSAYLAWTAHADWGAESAPARRWAIVPLALAGALLGLCWRAMGRGWTPETSDRLAIFTAAFLLLVAAAVFLFVGIRALQSIRFPLGFLVFAIPLPSGSREAVEHFLQRGSADVANGFFAVSLMPFWREGLVFHLSDISIHVAPECSGIHSSVVLLITSVLAAHLFLRGFWRKAALVCAVLPLALLRNGFRIWVIGELCAHIGPQMINSYIHRKGGPIFFVLSLIPFFLLLQWLRRSRGGPGTQTKAEAS
ncbi:MAG: exosortase/archaeosortase family protein [Opitutaceae bacterium]